MKKVPNGNWLIGLGIFLVVFMFVFPVFRGSMSQSTLGMFLILFLLSGILCIILGSVKKSQSKRYAPYLAVLATETRAVVISKMLARPLPVVIGDLHAMISKGYVSVSGVDFTADFGATAQNGQRAERKDSGIATVDCKYCSGKNEIGRGKEAVCKYCGAPLPM